MELKENAVLKFRSGFNCAQSVISSYSEKLEVNSDFLEKLSSGFGGGMGHMQEKCGAVTGSFMVISIYCGEKYPDNSERKEEAYKLIREFDRRFIELHGTTNCRSLINCDIESEEGHQYAVDNNLFRIICEKCIENSVDILDDLLS